MAELIILGSVWDWAPPPNNLQPVFIFSNMEKIQLTRLNENWTWNGQDNELG